MNWQEVSGNWILSPPRPSAIIHFLGGAFVAAAPHLTYRWLLENLCREGYIVVATPFINTFDHGEIAEEVLTTFEQAMIYLRKYVLTQQYIPIYGLGHSMGCKVHLLIGSLYSVERAGNIFMAFNNYPAKRSIPLLEQIIDFSPALDVEFTPSPEEVNRLIAERYQVRRNLLIKFRNDTLDQTRPLTETLRQRFPDMTSLQILKGSHTTPVAQDISWRPGNTFSPLDALGQFVKQEFYRDLEQLRKAILLWMDPLSEGWGGGGSGGSRGRWGR